MKKLILIVLLFTAACHKVDLKQQRAMGLVKQYVKDNLITDQKDYESISFSRLITLRDHYDKTAAGSALEEQIKLENDSMAKLDSEGRIFA